MKVIHYFIPQGAVVNIESEKLIFKSFFQGKESIQEWNRSNTLIFDTGNHLGDGIIDHHQPGTEDLCVTSLVALFPEKYLGHIDKSLEEINIITHFFPDFDAIGSTYLAIKWLENRQMLKNANIIADYINEVDSGKLTLDINYPLNPASMILAISDIISNNGDIPFPEKHTSILKRSYNFIDKIFEIFQTKSNPWSVDFLDNLAEFDLEINNIHKDVKTYRNDLQRSQFLTLKLINNGTNVLEDVDFIATDNPKSFLWKYWVRGDRINSPQKNGFIFTCAFFDTFKNQNRNRAIIATDPNTPYALKGLGILIERLEIEKLLESGETEENLTNNSRPGFHRADPWYDGRAPVHNYTIIDAPRAGSMLSNDDLIDIIGRYEYWNEIGKRVSEFSEFTKVQDLKLLSNQAILEAYSEDDKTNVVNLNIDQLEVSLKNLDNFLNALTTLSIKNNIWESKRISIRSNILDSFINFMNLLPKTDQEYWGDILTETITKYFPNENVNYWLKNSTNLSVHSLLLILNKLVPTIERQNILQLVLDVQRKHNDSYSKLLKKLKEPENAKFSPEVQDLVFTLLELFEIENNDNETLNELPLYSFENFKNYFDDIFVSKSLHEHQTLNEQLTEYLFSDLSVILEKDINFISQPNFLTNFQNYFASLISIDVFGENYKNFRDIKSQLLQSESGKKFGSYKKISPEEYLRFSFRDIQSSLNYFKQNFDTNNADEKQFVDYLEFISKYNAFLNLSKRLSILLKIKKFQRYSKVTDYLEQHYPDISLLENLYVQLFEFAINNTFIDSANVVVDKVTQIVESINKLKSMPKSAITHNIQIFLDKLYEYFNRVIVEYNTPISNIDTLSELCLTQINSISNIQDGILSISSETLPVFFQQLTKDIFVSQNRYYSAKIEFIQNKIKGLDEVASTESLNEVEKEKKYYELSNYILNKTVSYDWKSLKNFVDSAKESNIKEAFYKKYFYWYDLGIEVANDNADNNNKEKLYSLNSKFRKVFGGDSKNFYKSIDKLPKVEDATKYDSHLKKLIYKLGMDNIIEDLNNLIYVNTYEHISDFFINKFDVENLATSLKSFSSTFPKYYVLFTKTKFIQGIVLFLLLLLFGSGIFDQNSYPISDDTAVSTTLSPISEAIHKYLGDSIFSGISHIFEYFWLLFIFTIFIAPFIFGILQLGKLFTSKKSEVNKPKFLDLLRKVESKKSSLLYLQFITPLLLVLLNIASPDTISLLNNFTGFRFISIVLIIIAMIFISVYREISAVNPDKTSSWIVSRTKHMIWLYLLQSTIITIFLVDLILRYQIDLQGLFPNAGDYFMFGISKYIPYSISISAINFEFDIVIMPITTVLISLLSLFFSFFIDKIFGGGGE